METTNKNILRAPLTRAVALAAGVLLLASCGQTNPPSTEDVNEGIEFFELEGVTAADGGPVNCALYGSDSYGTSQSKSWFGFVCDFEGDATFPGEPVQQPQS